MALAADVVVPAVVARILARELDADRAATYIEKITNVQHARCWTRALASIAYPTLEMYFVKGADRQARELASR